MSISHQRLDKFLTIQQNLNKRAIKLLLAQKKVRVDGTVIYDGALIIHRFSLVEVDGVICQQNQPSYIMLHKPTGVVCATSDAKHKTVIDLIRTDMGENLANSLHIVGRLDLNTSGLVLLTNDSRWSSKIMSPEHKVEKRYCVTLENALTPEYVSAFEKGMYFEYEDITTLPAKLEIESSHIAQVTLIEGRYHQIKRMFGRFRNPVVKLHRSSIGALELDASLSPGSSRHLTKDEFSHFFLN